MSDNPPHGIPAQNDVEDINSASFVTVNYGQHIIKTTEDKIRLCLNTKINELIEVIRYKEIWIAPLGILITIVIVFPTTEFQDWLFLGVVWNAIFVIAAIATFVWLIISVIRAVKTKNKSTSDIVNNIIFEISGNQRGPNTTTSQEATTTDQR